jgi:6-phosphogluconate dehydrogenase
LDSSVVQLLQKKEKDTRSVIVAAVQKGIPAAAMMTALSYFDAYRTKNLPTNLVQAQRDFFGAHTYQRTDVQGVFHTEWGKAPDVKSKA